VNSPTTTTAVSSILIAGRWRSANGRQTFRATNPATGVELAGAYPISDWTDCEGILAAAAAAFASLRALPAEQIAAFLTRYADRIEARADEITSKASEETALAVAPRLRDVELPRTVNQLRQAALAAVNASWRLPTIDSKANIRSYLAPLGPVVVFGPNNFPLAFNGVAGGDFAAAIAAGNPVIAKAHPLHPGTSRLLAEEALGAIEESGMPPATVQMLYHLDPRDGERLVADRRVGAIGFTGGRSSGLKLKAAADHVGKPIFLELSSINPVIVLPGALEERAEQIATDFAASCLMASGQFCTSPGLLLLIASPGSDHLIRQIADKFAAAAPGPLLSADVASTLRTNIARLRESGAELLTGDQAASLPGHRHANTLLRISGQQFLDQPETFQTEVFGNASMVVVAKDSAEAVRVTAHFEGALTGSIYSQTTGQDDADYAVLADLLRWRVGRLLNDKMPTGVAVSPAMNHGGPFPATGHPQFTSVGIPASLRRFTMLQCFDNVRADRLPAVLRDKSPGSQPWRLIDGLLTQGDVAL
jgi:2,5-dioxopentanoate dehydrogenase